RAAGPAGVDQHRPELRLGLAAAVRPAQQSDQGRHQLQLKGPAPSAGGASRRRGAERRGDAERLPAATVAQHLLGTESDLLHEPGEDGVSVSGSRLLVFFLAAAVLRLAHHHQPL
uniref:Uncharacterized protein n=1 Tax=Gasterosteus aculeatus TaxID=69293 RepID=G3NZK3_GASAC